jgi:hypothetical protein
MNDAQRGTSTTGVGADGEDLNVVLGRFQSWKAGRKEPSAPDLSNNSGTKESTSGNAAILSSDAREISYDQALRVSRYRRHEEVFSFDPIPDAPLSFARERPLGDSPTKDDLQATISRWNDADDLKLQSRVSRWPEVSFIKATAAVADFPATVHPPTSLAAPIFEPVAARELVEASTSIPGPVAAKTVKASEPSSPDGPTRSNRSDSSAAAGAEPPAATARPSSHGTRPETTFREVLKRTSSKTAATPQRSVCLTLQAADGEQARLQESAAKESLSAAVYLRQCSLNMDDLRVQIEIALSRVRKEQQDQSRAKLGGISASLRQFGARWRRKLRRWNDDFPGLSAR